MPHNDCRIAGWAVAVLLAQFGMVGPVWAGTESFRQTCSIVTDRLVGGQRLIIADCGVGTTHHAGFYSLPDINHTELVVPPNGCTDIENRFGKLRCLHVSGPFGSWSQSCRNSYFDDDQIVFHASCEREDGDWAYTAIDMRVCAKNMLMNFDGQLRCQN